MPNIADDRPVTFDALDWSESADTAADSSLADPPAADAPAASSPEPATVAPVETPREGDGNGHDVGPIPFDRHKAILEGERKKLTDAEAKWQRVAWAEELSSAGKTPDQIREALRIYDGIDSDPIGFLDSFRANLEAHPTYAAQARSWAAKMLATGRQAQPQDDPEPEPDYKDSAGTPFYSGPQLRKWQEWRERKITSDLTSSVQQQLAPLKEAEARREQAERQRQAAEVVAQHVGAAKSELEKMRGMAHFKEHEPKVREYMDKHGWQTPLPEAWLHVFYEHVLPTLSQTEKANAVADLRRQAASSSVSPRAAAPSTPASPNSFYDPKMKWSD